MQTPIVCLLGGLSLLFFAALLFALHRGRDVKASIKVWFAAFSFETTESRSARDVASKHR